MQESKLRRYLTAFGSWASLVLALFYLGVFILLRTKADFAVGIAFLSLSMAIRVFGKMVK